MRIEELVIIGLGLQESSWWEEKLWLIGPLALQLQLGCVAFCSCKRHVARACPAAPLQQTRNLWIPAAPGLQQQLTSFLASCSGCSTALHCTPATHLKYRIDRQQQQQSRPWVLRSNGGAGCRPKLEEMCQSIGSSAATSRSSRMLLLSLPQHSQLQLSSSIPPCHRLLCS